MERAALITGGSSGIGLAIARALGHDGYGLTVAARRPEKLESAAQGLRDESMDVLSVAANMAKEDDIKKVVDAHRDRFGRLDVLVNNAGVLEFARIADMPLASFRRVLEVNTVGCRLGIKAVIEPMKRAGGGSIVNISSIEGSPGPRGCPRTARASSPSAA